MPIYLFEPGKPMREIRSLITEKDPAPKSYALSVWPNHARSIFYVFSPRLEDWLEINPEGVPPEYRAMALLIPTP